MSDSDWITMKINAADKGVLDGLKAYLTQHGTQALPKNLQMYCESGITYGNIISAALLCLNGELRRLGQEDGYRARERAGRKGRTR